MLHHLRRYSDVGRHVRRGGMSDSKNPIRLLRKCAQLGVLVPKAGPEDDRICGVGDEAKTSYICGISTPTKPIIIRKWLSLVAQACLDRYKVRCRPMTVLGESCCWVVAQDSEGLAREDSEASCRLRRQGRAQPGPVRRYQRSRRGQLERSLAGPISALGGTDCCCWFVVCSEDHLLTDWQL